MTTGARLRQCIVLVIALVGAAYAWLGVVMNASFTAAAATAAAAEGYRRAVYVFAAICLGCFVIALRAVAILWRGRQRSRSPV